MRASGAAYIHTSDSSLLGHLRALTELKGGASFRTFRLHHEYAQPRFSWAASPWSVRNFPQQSCVALPVVIFSLFAD